MICEVVVGDGDKRGAAGAIDQAIRRICQVTVIHPHIGCPPNVNGIPIGRPMVGQLRRRDENGGRPRRPDVVYVDAKNYDMGDVLDGDLGAAHNMDSGAPAVDGLEARHDQLRIQLDRHAVGEDDPQRLRARDAVAQRPEGWVLRVVAVAGHHVDLAILPADGVSTEPDRAVRQRLPVAPPVRIAPPTIVDGVACAAPSHRRRQRGQHLA